MLPTRMLVATTAALVLFLSVLLALAAVPAPILGLRRYPRACLFVSLAGAVLAAALVIVDIAAPLTRWRFGYGLHGFATDYFLAMAHLAVPLRLIQDTPYPFFWTPRWVFWIGSLTPLIPVGGAFAVAAGYAARRVTPQVWLVTVVIGFVAILIFIAAGVDAAWAISTYGIPL